MRWFLLVLLLPIVADTRPAAAEKWVVYPDGSGNVPTIQAAIDAAAEGDTILLIDGTFSGDGNRDIDFRGKAVTVRSMSGDPTSCVIDCGGNEQEPHRGFLAVSNEDSTTVIQNLTVTNAWSDTLGGALFLVDSGPTVDQVHFLSNLGPGPGTVCFADYRSTVRMKNCRIDDNDGPSVIRLGNYNPPGDVLMSGCQVSSNRGDVIRASGDPDGECWLQIDDSHFLDNQGVVLGFIYGTVSAIISESVFGRNHAALDFVSDWWQHENWTFTNCEFFEHTGLAVRFYEGERVTVQGCEFRDNAGGAFEFDSEGICYVSDSSFVRNHRSDRASALEFRCSDIGPFAEVTGCSFEDNTGDRAAISIEGSFARADVTSCTFYRNHGAIRNYDGILEALGLTIVDTEGDAFWSKMAYSTISEVVIANSTGAAVFSRDSDTIISRCSLVGNGRGVSQIDVEDGQLGINASIVAFGPSGSIVADTSPFAPSIDCVNAFGNAGGDWVGDLESELGQNGNIAENPQFCDYNSGDYRLAESSPSLESNNSCGTMGRFPDAGCTSPASTTFNVAADGSGDLPTIQSALNASTTGDTISLGDGTFRGAGNQELHFFGKGVTLRSQSSVPANCVIDLEGSADSTRTGIYFVAGEDSATVVDGISITGAWTDTQGGAIYIDGATPTLRNIHFFENRGSGAGTGLYAQNAPSLRVANCEFTANEGSSAMEFVRIGDEHAPGVILDGIHFSGNGGDALKSRTYEQNVQISECYFTSNHRAFNLGGDSFHLSMSSCTVLENTEAGYFDGSEFGSLLPRGLYGSVTMTDCFVRLNQGRLILQGGLVGIERTYFLDNSPDGALELSGEAQVAIQDCSFERNSSVQDGGALRFVGAPIGLISRTRFVENESSENGGAIFEDTEWGFSADSVEFVSNHADRGGAWYKNRSQFGYDTQVTSSLFASNSARHGGAVCLDEATFNAVGCTYVANLADQGSHIWTDGGYPTAVTIDRSILAFGIGESIHCIPDELFPATIDATCTDIFGNSGGDWSSDCLAGQLGANGNISADPQFCDRTNLDYSLAIDSPCLGENNPAECGTMGFLPDAGCDTVRGVVLDLLPDGSGDFPTIQSAINFAVTPDTISLAAGTYSGDGNRGLDFGGKAIVLRSADGNPSTTIIDCGGSQSEPHRGLIFQSGEDTTSVVEGITIVGGAAYGGGTDRFGGAIYCTGSSPTIRNCILELNEAERNGGAINLFQSEAIIEDCVIRGNTAPWGGGINSSSSSPHIIRTQITGNLATEGGGGIRAFGQGSIAPMLSNSTVAANHAPLGGGALVASDCNLTVENTIVWANCADDGDNFRLDDAESVADLICSNVQLGTVSLAPGATFDTSGGGNIASDPAFCGPLDCGDAPSVGGDFSLAIISPCLEENSPTGCGLIGALGQGCDETSDTPSTTEVLGGQVSLTCSPNPFTDRVVFQVYAPSGDVDVAIFDAAGKRVRTLASGAEPGRIELDWNGRNASGKQVASGIYFCRVRSSGSTETVRVVAVTR